MLATIMVALSLLIRNEGAAATASAPQLQSPRDAMEMTDVSTSFSWLPMAGCKTFDIAIAGDVAMSSTRVSKRISNQGYHSNCYRPKDLLPPGTYWWRVRGVIDGQEGPWSVTSHVTVNADHRIAPEPIRRIDADNPLFLMRSRAWDPLLHDEHIKEIIPEGLGRIIVVDDTAMASPSAIERARKYQELGIDFVVWNNRCQVPLATIESIFQSCSHCMGTAEGEHFSGMYWERGPEGNLSECDYVHHAWSLCAKYGRFYFFADGDGGHYRWPEFAQREKDELSLYRRNIVLMFKTTNGDMALHSYGSMEGFMASGSVENTGTWVDEWIWPMCGFGKEGEIIPSDKIWEHRRAVGTRECPWVYDVQMWLMGIASGSTVFQLESAHQWSAVGAGQAQYDRYYLPFISAVAKHHLLPGKDAFIHGIKIAVTSDPDLAAPPHHKHYTGAFAYLHELYAIEGEGDQEFIPNDSRYGIVCLLPPWVTSAVGIGRVVPQRSLADPSKGVAEFAAAYPQRFSGSAFMWECDGTVIVTNSNENADRDQSFAMPLEQAPFTLFSGSIGLHQYIVGKRSPDGRSFWFQANGNDPHRPMDVAFRSPMKPVLSCSRPQLCVVGWKEVDHACLLHLDFSEGAVEWSISP